jgi:CRP/FNR family transcriptional regulator, cyclic AMP receptor protein
MTKPADHTLRDIPLLASMPPYAREAIELQCRWRSFSADEQIIDRQSTNRDVFFITRGKIQVVMYSLSGREITFDDSEAGGHFGELAAIDGQPRSANVVALENTTVAIMSPDTFNRVLLDHPAIAQQLMIRMAKVIRTSTDRIMDLSTLGANNRVYGELLNLSKQGLRGDNTARIKPIPTHGDIASRVSTTRETVARVLSDLARAELVRREATELLINDVARLTNMVEEFRGH